MLRFLKTAAEAAAVKIVVTEEDVMMVEEKEENEVEAIEAQETIEAVVKDRKEMKEEAAVLKRKTKKVETLNQEKILNFQEEVIEEVPVAATTNQPEPEGEDDACNLLVNFSIMFSVSFPFQCYNFIF